MSNRAFAALIIFTLATVVTWDRYSGVTTAATTHSRNYPEPQYIKYQTNLTDEQMMFLARRQARQTETGDGALGVIEQGKKGLITLKDNQDIRVVQTCIRALRERGADADYIYTSQLLEMYGYPKKYAVAVRDSIDPIRQANLRLSEGVKNYRLSGENFSPEAWAQVPERAVNPEEADQRKRTEFKNTALKRYLGSHPEYDYVFVEWSGGPTIGALSALLGRKFSRGWAIDTVADLERDATIPREVVNAIEQKVLEVLPWIRHVRVTDPEGTDIEFSLSRKQARLWRMGAYEGNHLRMYPPQATGGLYEAFGIKDVVIPEADGVIGGTNGHSSALMVPGIRVRVESGAVVNVEGGGLQGLLMNDIRKKYQDYQIPFVPHPGWLFVYHGSMHVNPKEGTANIHWGFGVDIHIPEVQEYAEKYGIPLTHCFHVDNRFPTYEATVVGGRKIRIIDKGHLFALDDPEVRAIASKYGDPDDILRAEGAEPIPGVNAPGDYWKDYGQDAADYLAKQREELRSGKSPYLFSVLPMQLRMMLTGSGNRE